MHFIHPLAPDRLKKLGSNNYWPKVTQGHNGLPGLKTWTKRSWLVSEVVWSQNQWRVCAAPGGPCTQEKLKHNSISAASLSPAELFTRTFVWFAHKLNPVQPPHEEHQKHVSESGRRGRKVTWPFIHWTFLRIVHVVLCVRLRRLQRKNTQI